MGTCAQHILRWVCASAHLCNLIIHCCALFGQVGKKSKRKVQGVPQSQAATLPRHKEERETDKTKQAQLKQTYENTKIISVFAKRDNRNAKKTEKHNNKIPQGKT